MGAREFPTLGAGKVGETEAQGPGSSAGDVQPLLMGISANSPPRPAAHGLAVQCGSIPGDFTAAAFAWAARSPRSPEDGLPARKGIFLSRCLWCWHCAAAAAAGMVPALPLSPAPRLGLPGGHLPSYFCPSCSWTTPTGQELVLNRDPSSQGASYMAPSTSPCPSPSRGSVISPDFRPKRVSFICFTLVCTLPRSKASFQSWALKYSISRR